MLLRTRVILIVLMALLAVGYVLVQAAYEREKVVDRRFAEASEAGLAALWKEVYANVLGPLATDAEHLSREPKLIQAVRGGDRAALSEFIWAERGGDQTHQPPSHIDIVDSGNQVLFTLSEAVFPQPAFGEATVERTLATQRPIDGLRYDRDLGFVLLVATALRDPDGRAVGAVTVGTGLTQALNRMRASTGNDLVVVSRRGRFLAGTAADLWQRVSDADRVQLDAPIQTVDLGDRVYTLVGTELRGLGGAQTAYLMSLRDTTDHALAARRLTWVSVGISASLVSIILLGLFFYLRRSFQPLDRSIGVLDALSRGDTSVGGDPSTRDDEVGRLSRNIDVFRFQAIALQGLERARDRQRRRQERLIRNQMMALAQTLDEVEREGVIGDLDEIEAMSREGNDARKTTDGPDGLGVMAIALRKLAGRVIGQQNRLRQLIEELSEALKTKMAFQALQQELDIAARIQMSILPRPMPRTPEFEIAGQMTSAKEVGGDYYDFFMLAPDRLAVAIADVSGKGVGAAFFMTITRTLLRATTALVSDPSTTIERLNDMLSRDNDEGMFVTMFYGVANFTTGEFVYVNAGHDAPLRRRANGETEMLQAPQGVALGVIEGFTFTAGRTMLAPDDVLFLFTDGVTEAANHDQELYTGKRLLDLFGRMRETQPGAVIDTIVADVRAFENGAPQADDITCLALHVRDGVGREKPEESRD
jgi:sigma-B regulation protein RsbU (phosphoserine phosphatase)